MRVALKGVHWRGCIVVHIGDNMNVRDWLNGRAPRPHLARRMIRMITYFELVGRFSLLSTFARTYHNITADDLTRCDEGQAGEVAKGAGLELVSSKEEWKQALAACEGMEVPVLLGWDPLDFRIATQMKEQRLQRVVGAPVLPCERPLLVTEGGDWRRAWQNLGGNVGTKFEDKCWAAHSCGPDPSGKDGKGFTRRAILGGATRMVLEGPENMTRLASSTS